MAGFGVEETMESSAASTLKLPARGVLGVRAADADYIPPIAVTPWAGSTGSGTPRHDAVMRLHYLHFVQKRGHQKVQEVIEARSQENKSHDAAMQRSHKRRLKKLNVAMDAKVQHALTDGSMSIRTQEETDRIEEARQNLDEAKAKVTKQMHERVRSYRKETHAMAERVRAKPAINFRTWEDHQRIEEARRDPDEAREKMEKHMKQRAANYKKQREKMDEHVKAQAAFSFWTSDEHERIEEARQDPDEALEKMTKHAAQVARKARHEMKDMMDRVHAAPKMNFRTKDEIEEIEEARQDPMEASAKMRQTMKERRIAYKQQKKRMQQRVEAIPAFSMWTTEEQERIEEVRQDPTEAKAEMTAFMDSQSRMYRQMRRDMDRRVDALPAMTFRSKEERDRLDMMKGSLQMSKTAR